MSIISRIATKKEFKLLLDQEEQIFEQANNCLNPVNKVYWHYYLRIKNCNPPFSENQLTAELTTLDVYIIQLYKLHKQIVDMFQKHEHILGKCYRALPKHFSLLKKNLDTITNNIYDLQDHSTIPEFKNTLRQLDSLTKKLDMILNSSTTIQHSPII